MKKQKKGRILVLLTAALLSLPLAAGCNQERKETSAPESSAISPTESSTEEESTPAEPSTEPESSAEESSEPESSEPEEESSEAESEEPSVEETSDEKSAAEISVDGYQFDDEQIVKDYHSVTVFTDNDAFNAVFEDNQLDAQYKKELMTAETGSQMRGITGSYVNKWKDKVDVIYQALNELLNDRPEENAKLVQSQDEWVSSIGTAESSFYSEASDGGTEGLLAAETAIMNYFKGRAAVLLEQIYELNGSVTLADYGL